jgi:hypothetical protein
MAQLNLGTLPDDVYDWLRLEMAWATYDRTPARSLSSFAKEVLVGERRTLLDRVLSLCIDATSYAELESYLKCGDRMGRELLAGVLRFAVRSKRLRQMEDDMYLTCDRHLAARR